MMKTEPPGLKKRSHAVEPVSARKISGSYRPRRRRRTVFARDLGCVADKRLDLRSTPASAAKRAMWLAWDGTQVTAVT